ncbi:MAG: WYL domain-containing protein [Actinobacteria bacterium]|nr:MAG: WYL domain-containing protein [Actinomycetota bacterium]
MSSRTDAGDRLRRLLAILPWLADRGGAPISEVAARFEMPEAEVVALLELAACCGLPPYTPDQLIELIVSDEWVSANLGAHLTRPRRLSAAEGFTVAASARAILAVPGADPGGALARALAKLETVLGDRSRIAIDLDEPANMSVVRRAVADRRRLEIDYYSASRDERTTRQVDPYSVVASEGHWYLDGFCHLAGDVRLFRVDRIQDARVVGDTFDPPAARVRERVFAPGPDASPVRLAIPAAARWVVEAYPTLAVEEQADDRLTVTLAVSGTAWLERLLLRLGPGAEVVDPPDLVDTGRRAAERVLAAYR